MPARYNSGIQRSKGLMEIAAGLYDTSLSRRITRGGNTAPQIDTRLGIRVSITFDMPPGRFVPDGVGLTLTHGGGVRDALMRVGRKETSMIWLNPSWVVTMAYRGIGPFQEAQNIRTLAVLPSWDALAFAVHESTGITSIEQILERRKPLRTSVREVTTASVDDHATMYTVTKLLGLAGFSLDDMRAWGGSVNPVPRPSHPDRSDAMKAGKLDAVFDEGVLSWASFAIDHGFRILPIEGALAEKMEQAGYQLTLLTKERIPGLKTPVPTISFSGWPMVVHADMPDEVAYALCESLEARKELIPTDNYKPLDIAQVCSGDDETPRGVPLHPGAEKFYRERGYLKTAKAG